MRTRPHHTEVDQAQTAEALLRSPGTGEIEMVIDEFRSGFVAVPPLPTPLGAGARGPHPQISALQCLLLDSLARLHPDEEVVMLSPNNHD